MPNEKIILMAEANKLKIPNYRKLSESELRAAISAAQGTSTPAKGKGKPVATNGTAPVKGKGKTAPVKGKSAPVVSAPVKGKGKSASAPAKSTAQKSTPVKGKAAQGTAKRQTPSTKGKAATAKAATTAKPRTARTSKATESSRSAVKLTAKQWQMESNVGRTGKRKLVMDALRETQGDYSLVFKKLKKKAVKFYPAKEQHAAERMLVWLIGRVAYDFAMNIGGHEPGNRASYGTSVKPQDVRRREAREAQRATEAKAVRKSKRLEREAQRVTSKAAPAKGKTTPKGKTGAKGKSK